MKYIMYYNKKYVCYMFIKLIMHLYLNNINIINKYMHTFDIYIVINT